jgi:tetratricopeptide (TPR) repeat protein
MGKAHKVAGRRVSRPLKNAKSSGTNSADELFRHAQQCYELGDIENAYASATKVLESNEKHSEALQLAGMCSLELGNPENAHSLLLAGWNQADGRRRNPDVALYLAQLSAGMEAIQWYQNAVDLMKELQQEARKIAEALCGMAEIYLTDLWYSFSYSLWMIADGF